MTQTQRERDRAERARAGRVPKIVTYDPLWPSVRQPGRRYGPAPKTSPDSPTASSPAPMQPIHREVTYRRQNDNPSSLTPRQRRRIKHKFNRFNMPIENRGPRD